MNKNFTQRHKVGQYVAGFALIVLSCQMPQKSFALSGTALLQQPVQQTLTIKGVVLDEADGQPLPGATIMDAQRKVLGTTNGSGGFQIRVAKGTSITFTMIGYGAATRVINSSQENLSIRLKEESNALNEVVVTALGIKREEKSLGYATTTVKGEALTEALSNNWTDALSGKVAGLNLVRSGGGPAGSNSIILRGESNLTGDNQALIVVDGVVINNGSGRMTGTGSTGYLQDDSPVDFGSGLNDINPEDIETVSVLKGPGAAALYGQRGANGAIIITTKSGRSRIKGIGVSINSNTSFESISRWPDFQNEYGQGVEGANYYSYGASVDGPNTRSTSSAWGPKFDGQMFFQYDPATQKVGEERTPWIPYPDARKDFFNTGKTFTNSVTLDGGTDKTSVRFSATNVNNQWIIPNTGYKRNTIALSANQKVTDALQISTKINYTNKWSDNLPSTGYNNQSIMYWNNLWVPNGDSNWLTDYWMNGQEGILQNYPFSSLPDNPYLIAYEMLNKTNRNTITGNIQASYNFTKELSLMVRTSMDFGYDERSQRRPKDTEKFKEGMFRNQNIFSQEVNSDFLLRYSKKINKKFETTLSFGGSNLNNKYIKDELRAEALIFPQVYSLANSKQVIRTLPNRSSYTINSLYGLATMSYNNYLFLDVTGRNDWSSILATPTSSSNSSFFYPSVNASAVISEMFELPRAFSFAKLRGSVSKVGSGLLVPYRTSYTYVPASEFDGGLSNPTNIPNLNLKPLTTISYELGFDLRLFKSRIGLDVAVYSSDTKDQILSASVDRASGANNAIVNSGLVRNRGVEVQLNGEILKSKKGLNWKAFGTFSANDNTVLELTQDLSVLQIQRGPAGKGYVEAHLGMNMGGLYGPGYQRAPDGQIIYQNGYPLRTADMIYLGNTTAKWKASVGNEFRLKNFKMNVLFDGQYGAVGYSLTSAVLAEQGKTKNTLPGRYNGIIGKGVIRTAEGTFRPNDVIAENIVTYYESHLGRENLEGSTYKTDFLKLRELRFDYNLSTKLASRFGLQKASIGVYGRDLYTWSHWPAFDPEFGTLNDGSIDKGFELGQLPSTRTVGVNLIIGI
jgi:TonB-linked SusC/RagA family outer membrane protein